MLKRIENKKVGSFETTLLLINQFILLNKKRIKQLDLEIFCKELDRSFGETFNYKVIFLTTLKFYYYSFFNKKAVVKQPLFTMF